MQINQSLAILKNLLEIIDQNDLLSQYQNLIDIYSKAESKQLNDNTKINNTINLINSTEQELATLFWYSPVKILFKNNDIEKLTNPKDLIAPNKPEEFTPFIAICNDKISLIKPLLDIVKRHIEEFNQLILNEDATALTDNTLKYFQIFFTEESKINTIEELEKFTRIWNNIISIFSRLTREEDITIGVHLIDKSCFILNLGEKTINALMKAILDTINTYKRLLEIRNLKTEIKNVELSNEAEFERLLEEESTNIIEDHSAVITKELLNTFEWEYSQNQKMYDNVQVATRQILGFIKKGGKISCKQNIKNDGLNKISKQFSSEIFRINNLLNKIG